MTTTHPDLLTTARAIPMILNAAKHGCLPRPTRYEGIEHGGDSTLTFYMADADALYAWATWLDEPVDEFGCVDGELCGQALRVALGGVR